jgi:hypothetical protein
MGTWSGEAYLGVHRPAKYIAMFFLRLQLKAILRALSLKECHGLFTLGSTGLKFYSMLADL